MRKILIAMMLCVPALAVSAADAQVNARQLNQERRIDAGRRSGKLTAHEAMKLRGEQRSIRMMASRRRAMHGGHLTRHDKMVIHQHQAAANRDILREKHNGRRASDHPVVKIKL